VRRVAARQFKVLPEASRSALMSYTAGINAVLASMRESSSMARPPEMLILGIKPEDWDPVDSLAWAIMMAWDLGGNWNNELLRLRLALLMPTDRVDTFLPPYPGDRPLVATDYAALYKRLGLGQGATKAAALDWHRLTAIAPPSGVEGVGSNNWVIAGSHTTTGKPLLANDPHLKLSSPALWYFARLQAPGFDVAGATMPGLPSVVLGQNAKLAWGFTNTGPDVQDLYLEQIDPGDPRRYRTPDGWAAFESNSETLKVRGKPDVEMTVRRSRHGPIISDAGTAAELLGAADKPRYALAMRWTALDADADPIGAGLALNRAESVAQFIDAARTWVAPMQNMVVADSAGAIGVISPGRIPLRKPENDLKGLVPAPGWEAKYDWAGWLPYEELWREVNPARGWIATANQRVTAPGYAHFLTSEWALPYRQQRIEQLLGAKAKHSIEDLAAIQADVQSLAARPLLPAFTKAAQASTHRLAVAARAQLQGFDGLMAADRAAPLIYWAWQRQLGRGIFLDDAGAELWDRSLATRSFQDSLEAVLARDDASWCDDRTTPAAESCAAQSSAAFDRALDEIAQRFGEDAAAWRWGAAHQARSEHRPFSRVKALARWFEQRVPTGGDTFTVNVSRVGLKADATSGELYLNEHAASLRALYDLGERKQSRVMHSTGQSGLPFSPLFRSFAQPWAEVRYVPLWTDKPSAATLTINPARRPPG
jgi:penicillin amidase